MDTVKSENYEKSTLTDESFSIFNIHAPSGVGGAGVGGAGTGLPRLRPGPSKEQEAGGGKESSNHTRDPEATGIGRDTGGAAGDTRVSLVFM